MDCTETTLYNGKSAKCAAYCKHHHCGVTVKQIKAKRCLSKHCKYLVKYEGHLWWRERAALKRKKKERKAALWA